MPKNKKINWEAEIRAAQQELDRNRRLIDDTARTGTACHQTLERRCFQAGPQNGGQIPKPRYFG